MLHRVILSGESSVLVKEKDPQGWSTVLVTALGNVLGKPVPRGHLVRDEQERSILANRINTYRSITPSLSCVPLIASCIPAWLCSTTRNLPASRPTREHSGPFREHFGNIQGTFREHPGNIQRVQNIQRGRSVPRYNVIW
jgi:hypothetical protein